MRWVAKVISGIVLASVLGGCFGPKRPLNPPRLVMAQETDLSIQLFMQATLLLANAYGFQTIRYADFQERSAKAGFNMLPFMPPETIRATPEFVSLTSKLGDTDAYAQEIVNRYGYKPLIKYYINTGWRASQLICRNYLLGLDEQNQYLEFLQKEFGVAFTLATGILQAANANKTLLNAFAISRSAVDGGIDVYQEYRFLNVDREAARSVVEAAQNKYAQYFIDLAEKTGGQGIGGYTLSDALNAVSVIEYQCTREGIRNLLNRAVNNTPTNLEIDAATGTVMFKSSQLAQPATMRTVVPAAVAAVPVTRVPVAPSAKQKATNEGSSRAGQSESATILLNYLRRGDAAARTLARKNLQNLLADDRVKGLSNLPPNLQIENVIARPEFEEVRRLLVTIAREQIPNF
jgi:hypothetical protein